MAQLDTAPQRRRGPAALDRRGFRQLTVAWVFTNAADSALWLMLAVWVKDLTGSDGAAAAVFVALGLPTLLAPFIGHLADRVSRRSLLAAGNAVMVPAVLALVLVRDADDVWLVYAVTFVYGAMGYVTASAQSGLVRDLLDDDELPGGNGLLSTVDQAFRLVSPLLGTALYVAAGPLAVIALTGACFATTAALLTRVEVLETPPEPSTGARFWSELSLGLRHLLTTAPLGALTVALAVATGATGLVNVAVFPLMEQGLGVDPALLGVFVSLQGVGAVVGGLTAARVLGRLGEPLAVALGLGTMAVGMLPLLLVGVLDAPAAVTLPLAATGLAVLGLGVPWAIVAFITLRQRLTPARLQGRVSAATNIALNLPQTLVTLAAAAVVGVLDYRVLVAVTIAGVLAAGALALRAGRPTH
ncbi:MFS transporter [Georgenia satyanarayanai]|uniref:MFS transporter n=1 Tax=Georgenia satyanarayanai TaxID=860221 RepID=UPI00203C989D|nr:MFS transporter [Georgenia satyanarayanai]MCM3660514.1 MFS transporter [Georgenia satyanarayanai]